MHELLRPRLPCRMNYALGQFIQLHEILGGNPVVNPLGPGATEESSSLIHFIKNFSGFF